MPFERYDTTVLVLFVAVHRDDQTTVEYGAQIPRRLMGSTPYVGFRTSPEQAMWRARLVHPQGGASVSKVTHVLLQVEFSARVLADLTVTPAAGEYAFAPMLHKVVYRSDEETDWGVWHYCGDFPLELSGVRHCWREIE